MTLRVLAALGLGVTLPVGCSTVATIAIGYATSNAITLDVAGTSDAVRCRFEHGTAKFDVGLGVPCRVQIPREVERFEIVKSMADTELTVELAEPGSSPRRFVAPAGARGVRLTRTEVGWRSELLAVAESPG